MCIHKQLTMIEVYNYASRYIHVCMRFIYIFLAYWLCNYGSLISRPCPYFQRYMQKQIDPHTHVHMHRTTNYCTPHTRCSVMVNIYSSITQYETVHENSVLGDEAKSWHVTKIYGPVHFDGFACFHRTQAL